MLSYTPNNLEAHKRLKQQLSKMMKNTSCDFHGNGCHQGLSIEISSSVSRFRLQASPTRTARFASDMIRSTSALDINCKAHDLDNLYVVDGSFFPSSGAVNPALTIVANALRVGDHLWSGCMRITRRPGDAGMRRLMQSRRSLCFCAWITSQCASARPARRSALVVQSISVASLDRAVAFYTGSARILQLAKTDDSIPPARLAPGAPPADSGADSPSLVLGQNVST